MDAQGNVTASPQHKHMVVPPRLPEFTSNTLLQHSQSTMQLGQASLQLQATPEASPSDMDNRFRKSRSMRALGTTGSNGIALSSGAVGNPPPVRTSGSVSAPAHSAVPPAFTSPLIRHRTTMTTGSPMRGSLNAPGMVTAPSTSMAQSASTSALPGNASPQLVPKAGVPQRSVLAGRGGPARPNGSISAPSTSQLPPHAPLVAQNDVVRQATPVPLPKGHQGSRGSGGASSNAHSPSPAMMRRSVSTQALRVERGAAGGLGGPKQHEKPAMRSSHYATPGGPSPERQRPGGAASAVSPVRAMSPAQRAPQRQM